jgi:MFS family permease
MGYRHDPDHPESIEASSATADADFRTKRKRAILSAWAGFAMDSYSIYIATSTLLPALIYFQGDMSPEEKGIFAGMTLAVTLLGRPLGALIFGHFADVLGRRNVGAITIFGFGTLSLLIGCLPGAELVGAAVSTTLLIALRFIEGIFLGGEYTAATPMALEYALPTRRGFVGALIQCAASGGPLVVALLNSLVLMFASNDGLHSPYVQWGWRIPFILGFVLSALVAWFLRRHVEDSSVWKSVTIGKTTAPLKEMLKGRSGQAFAQAWIIMTGVFFLASIGSSVLTQFLLNNNEGYTAADLAHTQLVTPVISMGSYVFYGWLSDHIGRKPALYISGTLAMLLTPVTMTLIGLGNVQSWVGLTALATLTQVLFVGPFGVLPAYINERFATSVRSSGWGVAYSTAVIIPSFFPYYMLWLSHLMPFVYTAGVLMAFGGILIVAASAWGPETRGVDLNTVGSAEEQAMSLLRRSPAAGLGATAPTT